MIIGVPSEVKNNENRIGMTPDSVSKLTKKGHEVFVQESAGANIGFFDQDFISAGAKILKTPEDVYKSSEMIVKVKEPIPSEYKFLRDDLTLFTYLHLAGDPQNAKKLIDELGDENLKYINTNIMEEEPVKKAFSPYGETKQICENRLSASSKLNKYLRQNSVTFLTI